MIVDWLNENAGRSYPFVSRPQEVYTEITAITLSPGVIEWEAFYRLVSREDGAGATVGATATAWAYLVAELEDVCGETATAQPGVGAIDWEEIPEE